MDLGPRAERPGLAREPHGIDRHLQHQHPGRDRARELAVRIPAVLQRERVEQPDAGVQRSGWLV